MEQNEFKKVIISKGFDLECYDKLEEYLSMVKASSEKFNITGFKTIEDMRLGLAYDSFKSVSGLNVPRGTVFADIGTGAGVPGMVVCILYPHVRGVLVDSNNKKIDFIKETAEKLSLQNVDSQCVRGELFSAEKENREKYDFAVTKAFGPLYYSAEFCGPVLKQGGFLYIYSNLSQQVLSKELREQFNRTGLYDGIENERKDMGVSEEGLFWVKRAASPDNIPRRFPIIKREASKIPETVKETIN